MPIIRQTGSESPMLCSLILAGAPNDGALQEVSPAVNEALIEINGKYILDYIIETLRDTAEINKIVIVGPIQELKDRYQDVEVIQSEGTIMDNVSKGLHHLQNEEQILILTSDIPLITRDALQDFISQCRKLEADFYYPINSRETSENRFPGVHRTYITMKEGTFTGGNVFLTNTKAALAALPKAQQFIAMRKKPFQLARILGASFIYRFLTKSLLIADAERRVSEILGIRGKAIISEYAEIGVDVDKPEDLDLVRDYLKN